MQDYIYRDGKMLASESNDQFKTLHYHLDHLGTPRLITGNGGAQVARHTYYPFGEEVSGSPAIVIEPKKFTGHERDSGGIDYMHARYYDYSMGRFLSVDPAERRTTVSTSDSWNRYVYALNRPITLVDLDGREVYVMAGLQPAVDRGRQNSPAFAAMYDRLEADDRVYWRIAPIPRAARGTRAASTQTTPTRDANGVVTRTMTLSGIPSNNRTDVQTELIGHEGAHIIEVLDTNQTLEERYQSGERGTVYRNTAAGPDAYESTKVAI